MTKQRSWGSGRWQLPALVLGMATMVALRILTDHSHFAQGLPFYSIDENDIVEPAAGFLMGDWNHRYYAYGPGFMYLLSFLYAGFALLKGHSIHDFATDVFFDSYWHYYLARLVSLAIILGTAVVAVIGTCRLFSFRAAAICLVLVAFPIAENFTRYTARIDVLQAFFQLVALFSLIGVIRTGACRHFVWAGVWTGLAVAAKPLSGALIVPVALGAIAVRRWREETAAAGEEPIATRVRSGLEHAVSDRRIYVATVAAAVAFFVGFPYAVLDFKSFWAQQALRVQADTAAAFPRGLDLMHYVPQAGWFFCVLGALALLYHVLGGTESSRVMAGFVLVYLLAFAFVPAREYFFVAILAPVAICAALMLDDALEGVRRRATRVAVVVGLGALMLWTVPGLPASTAVGARIAVRRWILQNVPAGTSLCYAGWYTNGPRLVAKQLEAEIPNDYFMYGRDQNRKYSVGLAEAHRRYVLSGRPMYDIANWGRRSTATADNRAELLKFCREHGSRYLILGGVRPFEPLRDPVTSGGGITVFRL